VLAQEESKASPMLEMMKAEYGRPDTPSTGRSARLQMRNQLLSDEENRLIGQVFNDLESVLQSSILEDMEIFQTAQAKEAERDTAQMMLEVHRFMGNLHFSFNPTRDIAKFELGTQRYMFFLFVLSRALLNVIFMAYQVGTHPLGFTATVGDSSPKSSEVYFLAENFVVYIELIGAGTSFLFFLAFVGRVLFRRFTESLSRGHMLVEASDRLRDCAEFSSLKFMPSSASLLNFASISIPLYYHYVAKYISRPIALFVVTCVAIIYYGFKLLGLVVFVVKIQQIGFVVTEVFYTPWDYVEIIGFFAFVNNVASIVNLARAKEEALLDLVFSGGDGRMTPREMQYKISSLAFIAEALVDKYGVSKGIIAYISLTVPDLQQLFMREDSKSSYFEVASLKKNCLKDSKDAINMLVLRLAEYEKNADSSTFRSITPNSENSMHKPRLSASQITPLQRVSTQEYKRNYQPHLVSHPEVPEDFPSTFAFGRQEQLPIATASWAATPAAMATATASWPEAAFPATGNHAPTDAHTHPDQPGVYIPKDLQSIDKSKKKKKNRLKAKNRKAGPKQVAPIIDM
jgi:hypothetical protein